VESWNLRPSRILSATSSSQQRRIPKVRIETRQAASLMDQRIIVAIDSWPRNSAYPHGHLLRKLCTIGDKDISGAWCSSWCPCVRIWRLTFLPERNEKSRFSWADLHFAKVTCSLRFAWKIWRRTMLAFFGRNQFLLNLVRHKYWCSWSLPGSKYEYIGV